MSAPLSEWLHATLDFVFPAECQHCRGFLGDQRIVVFCRTCWNHITPITEPTCPVCGDADLRINSSYHQFCKHCTARAPSMDRTITAVYYDDVARTALHHFKFNHKTALGRPLTQLLLTNLPDDIEFSQYHAVIPVPLHSSRQRQRGYNQSAILARYVAKRVNVPIMSNNLRRIRPTDEQALIAGRDARRQNVEQAFHITSPASVQGKSVIVIDDIMTTGATVNECARVLKKAGATSVLVLAVARRVLRSQTEHIVPQ